MIRWKTEVDDSLVGKPVQGAGGRIVAHGPDRAFVYYAWWDALLHPKTAYKERQRRRQWWRMLEASSRAVF